MIEIDSIIFNFISGFTGRFFLVDWLFIFFSETTLYIIFGAFLLYAYRIKSWKDRWNTLALGAVSVIISRGITTPLFRFFFERPRPFQTFDIESLVSSATSSSFPSGHVTFVVPIAIALWYVNKKAGTWAFIGITLMGVARIASGVHWPTDILGGALVGVIAFVIGQMLLSNFPKEAKEPEEAKALSV